MKIRCPVKNALAMAAVLGVVGAAHRAEASTATATIGVTATVNATCVISANALAFGNYTNAVNNATTTVTATCTLGTPYNVGLDAGVGTGATVTIRKLTLGANLLNYALYSDTSRTIIWGNTIGTNTVIGTGSGLPQGITVYGQIPASQNVQSGNYTDSVTATITS